MPQSLLNCLNNCTSGKKSHGYSCNMTQSYSLKKLFVTEKFWNNIFVTHCTHLDNGAYMYILMLKTLTKYILKKLKFKFIIITFISISYSSSAQKFPTLCDPVSCSTPASLSSTNSQSPSKLISELVMPSNHLILCCPLLLPSIFPTTRVFSNESALHIR